MYWLLLLFLSWAIVLAVLLSVVWKHRENPFFTHRSVFIIFLAQISILIASIIISASIIVDISSDTKLSHTFCILLNCTYCVLLPICMLSSNLMTPSLIINSAVNRMKPERANGKFGEKWKWRMRHFCTTRAKLIILFITCIVQLFIYLVIQFNTTIDGNCQFYSLYPFIAVLGFYLIPISISGYKLLDVDDPFAIRLEILITTIFSLPSMVGVILFLAGVLPFDLQYVFLYALLVIFVCNLAFPVAILLQRPTLQRYDSTDNISLIFDTNNPHIYTALLQYSTKQYMAENILFYKTVDDYKTTVLADNLLETAQHIFDEYIEIDAVLQINIDHSIREVIRSNLANPTTQIFDVAHKAIRKLIIESILPGWKNDATFIEMVQSRQSTRTTSGSGIMTTIAHESSESHERV